MHGPPVGKERPRRGQGGRFYTPDATKRYQQQVGLAFLKAAKQRLDPPAVMVAVWCYFSSGRHPDPDNVLKAVLDGLEGLAYQNDKNVASCVTPVFHADHPRIEVAVS